MPDYLKLIKEQNEEQGLMDLHTRMDSDAALRNLDSFVMKDVKGDPIPDVVHVTLDRPRLIAEHIIAALGKAREQIVVESEEKDVDTFEIESFQKAMFKMADARLREQGQWQLNPYADNQFCMRGRAVRLVVVREEGGILIPDIVSWDARYFNYERGDGGFKWGSSTVKRGKAAINGQEWAKLKKFTLGKKDGIVTEVWDTEGSFIWVDKEKIWEQEHSFGYCPIVMQTVSLGSMLDDGNAEQHEGESVFFLFRKAIPQLQSLISIMQTLNLISIKPPAEEQTKEGTKAGLYKKRMAPGSMTPTQIGGGIKTIDFGDAKRAAEFALSMIDKAIQEGGLTSIDLGNLGFELSAIAIVQIGEGRNQVLKPRWDAKGWLNEDTAAMFTRQVTQLGHSIEVGTPGHKRTFDIGKLEGEYEVTYSYVPIDPVLDVARYTTAQAARPWMSDAQILEKIVKDEDPAGTLRKRNRQEAKALSPTVMRMEVIKGLLEEAEDGDEWAEREAVAMALEVGMSIEQVIAGNVPQLPEGREEPSGDVMKLFGSGGKPSSAQKAADLQKKPEG